MDEFLVSHKKVKISIMYILIDLIVLFYYSFLLFFFTWSKHLQLSILMWTIWTFPFTHNTFCPRNVLSCSFINIPLFYSFTINLNTP